MTARARLAVVCGVLLLVAACSDKDADVAPAGSPAAGATPVATISATASPGAGATATATTGPEAGPVDCPLPDRSVCTFAAAIEKLLLQLDFGAVADLVIPTEVTCAARTEGAPLEDICTGRPVGTKVSGYPLGRRYSEGGLATREEFIGAIQTHAKLTVADTRDDYGTGALRLYTIGAPLRNDCSNCYSFFYSSVQRLQVGDDRLMREALEVQAVKAGGKWGVDVILTGIFLPTEIDALLLGGTYEGRTYRTWNAKDGTAPAGSRNGVYFGATVTVTNTGSQCLNYRSQPTKQAALLDCLAEGTRLYVVGGPVQADGSRWWRVLHPNPGVPAGWVAGEFISVK